MTLPPSDRRHRLPRTPPRDLRLQVPPALSPSAVLPGQRHGQLLRQLPSMPHALVGPFQAGTRRWISPAPKLTRIHRNEAQRQFNCTTSLDPAPGKGGRRQDRLLRTESVFGPLPFDVDAARTYGRVFSPITPSQREPRGAQSIDLMIAATAPSAGLPLYTRNHTVFAGLHDLIDIVPV